jgi:hypothetical protein
MVCKDVETIQSRRKSLTFTSNGRKGDDLEMRRVCQSHAAEDVPYFDGLQRRAHLLKL